MCKQVALVPNKLDFQGGGVERNALREIQNKYIDFFRYEKESKWDEKKSDTCWNP